jgi:quercetin dioxygenase-like cupin family protein
VNEDRLREHPRDRLAAPVQVIGLGEASAQLRAELHAPVAGHRQVTLVRRGPVTIILFAFEGNGTLKEHRADGEVVIHVLSGGLHVTAGDDGRDLGPGSLMALAPGLLHSVRAVVASEMLLTIHKVRSD